MKMSPWILHSGYFKSNNNNNNNNNNVHFLSDRGIYFKSALKDLKRLFYQIDHIWGAPSMPKEPL